MLHQFRALAVAATLVAVSLPLAACSDESKLTIHSADGDHTFNIEIVDTAESRAQGLMYRQELAPDAGMLFDFLDDREVSFWMRNTFIPLDMLFITGEGVVKNIHVNARPHDPTGIPSDGPVQFVLEIPGGRSVELGIEAGDTVTHPRITAAK
ncbi:MULTISPECIES: DUF192 domain-containing protein [unclassified Devosia]|uniref:DUF192 domain-containing protein n=1 Tax=unclassified Devosia TaxID=196773 RepID=UPI0025FCBE45|nr:DUF192 domain-containing protein [Devosia sp.]MCR6633509.1 DUF192 domain-containing protein [Devosia sp.]